MEAFRSSILAHRFTHCRCSLQS